MRTVVYDTGALIAADRNERRVWAEHRVRLEAGLVPLVPAPVVAQASRSPKQVGLRRFLRGCEVLSLNEAGAHQAGDLLGKSRTRDIVDATVVAAAVRHHADIVSDDADDIRGLLSVAATRVRVMRV
jgi:hypothetical protein